MRSTLVLVGTVALLGTSLVLASGEPQQASPAPSQKAAAPSQVKAPAVEPKVEAATKPAMTPEAKAVADAVGACANAYNTADAAALGDLFTEEVVLTDPDCGELRGRKAVAEMYASSFQEHSGLKLETEVTEVRFVTPDVARVEGRSRLSAEGGDAAEFTRYSALLVRRDGKWRAAEIREFTTPAADVSPYERLRELEWMVGHWVDEGDEHKVESTVRWADNQSFLIRTYSVELRGEASHSGTMFIGWDPQCGQIKSWLFDSEGGHGEGLWTRTAENQWIVKANGVLHDGRPNSATQIHTILNKDSVKTSSIDRIIGGQVAPDIEDIVMVKKPPLPGPQETKPAAGEPNRPR